MVLSAHLWLAARPCLTAEPLPHKHSQEQPAVPRLGSPKKLSRTMVMLLMQLNETTGLGKKEKKRKRKK